MADRDVLELANDEEFGDGGMDDMDGEVWSFFNTNQLGLKMALFTCRIDLLRNPALLSSGFSNSISPRLRMRW